MARRGTALRAARRRPRSTADPIPEEVEEIIERRIAELRPLHDEYTQLLSYRRLVRRDGPASDNEETRHETTRATPGAARAAILQALADGPRTAEELTEDLPFIAPTVRYNLRRLARQGVILEAAGEETLTYRLADAASGEPGR